MKILYGVQGTGNGHLTRAIAMTETIETFFPKCEVDALISGRLEEKLPIKAKEIIWREGATFIIKNGGVQLVKTLLNFNKKPACVRRGLFFSSKIVENLTTHN